MKKLFALMLALAMMLTVAAAYAADLTITNATLGQTYKAYKVFDAYPTDAADLSKPISYTATNEQIALDGFTDIFDVAQRDAVKLAGICMGGHEEPHVLVLLEIVRPEGHYLRFLAIDRVIYLNGLTGHNGIIQQ